MKFTGCSFLANKQKEGSLRNNYLLIVKLHYNLARGHNVSAWNMLLSALPDIQIQREVKWPLCYFPAGSWPPLIQQSASPQLLFLGLTRNNRGGWGSGAGGSSSGQVLAQPKTAAPAPIRLVHKPANPQRKWVDAVQLAALYVHQSTSPPGARLTCCPAHLTSRKINPHVYYRSLNAFYQHLTLTPHI